MHDVISSMIHLILLGLAKFSARIVSAIALLFTASLSATLIGLYNFLNPTEHCLVGN